MVTVSECGFRAVVGAEIGGVAGKGAWEQALTRKLCGRLEEDWLLIADRNFCNWADWCAAADTGAALLWRVKSDLRLPLHGPLPDGSYTSVLVAPKITGKARDRLIQAVHAGQDLDPARARRVRVIEYEVPDRDRDGKGELIALITTITGMTDAPAAALAEAYHQRWEHETGNDQFETHLRGPGRVLRSRSPEHGPPGNLRLPAGALGHLRADLPGRNRGGHRPRPGEVHPHRPRRPPGHQPGLSPLNQRPAPRSWPTSPASGTSTPDAATAATLAWSSAPGATLPGQETCRQGHPPRKAANNRTGQPDQNRHGSLINIG